MIISNGTYNTTTKEVEQKPFIFLNPPQSGGFIVEMALEPHLNKNDIITPHPPHVLGNNFWKFYAHMNASEVQEKILHNYDAFPKVTIIRDPWEVVMSLYNNAVNHIDTIAHNPLWSKNIKKTARQRLMYSKNHRKFLKEVDEVKNELRILEKIDGKKVRTGVVDFFTYAQKMPSRWNKYEYYFFNGKKSSDIYLHFDTLQEDFNSFCEEFNLPKSQLDIKNLPTINEKEFCLENIKRYYTNNPENAFHEGNLKSDKVLHEELSDLMRSAADKIHWNYEILLNSINKEDTKGNLLEHTIEVNDFDYKKISQEKIDDIITTYLDQKHNKAS